MKSTGVVRRIDELGRIVIPKEIRRNLGIRDGENIEIFTENDSIILKKYYRMSTSSDLASNLCELVYNNFNYKIMITDREKIIACAGFSADIKNHLLNPEFLQIIEDREIKTKENTSLTIGEYTLNGNFVFIPIISLNDSIGLIIMYNESLLKDEIIIGKLIASIFSQKLDI